MSKERENQLQDWYNNLQAHATANYNHDGWDYFVETFDMERFIEVVSERHEDGLACTTYEEALAEVEWLCKLLDDRRRDIQGTAF